MIDTKEVLKVTQKCTIIEPEIYFREGSIMVMWQDNIPNKQETLMLQKTLTRFGVVIPNCYREARFVSFIIKDL